MHMYTHTHTHTHTQTLAHTARTHTYYEYRTGLMHLMFMITIYIYRGQTISVCTVGLWRCTKLSPEVCNMKNPCSKLQLKHNELSYPHVTLLGQR